MVIYVSLQYNGGFLPKIILSTLCDYIEESFKYNVEVLSLRPMFLPKRFDCSEGLAAFRFFLNSFRKKAAVCEEFGRPPKKRPQRRVTAWGNDKTKQFNPRG